MSERSNRCAVKGCPTSYIDMRKLGINLYRFSTRPWQAERMAKWTRFCKRKCLNGKVWKPTENSRICSIHFVGGSKSEHPRHPGYNPTLYPKILNQKTKHGQEKALARFLRAQRREGNCLTNTKSKPEYIIPSEDTDTNLPIDTARSSQSESCLLCFKGHPSVLPNGQSQRARTASCKETLRNLFQVMQISIKRLDERWPIVSDSWNLSFCRDCEMLIQRGLYLKKQLLAVQSDVVGHSCGWNPNLYEENKARESVGSAPRKLRCDIRKLIIGCEKNLLEEKPNLTDTERIGNDESTLQSPMHQTYSSPLRLDVSKENAVNFQPETVSPTPEQSVIPTITLPDVSDFTDPKLQPSSEKLSPNKSAEPSKITVPRLLRAHAFQKNYRPSPKLAVDRLVSCPKEPLSYLDLQTVAFGSPVNLADAGVRKVKTHHPCHSCQTTCSSEAILNLHREEEHGLSEDTKLVYNCDWCGGQLNAFMFSEKDVPASMRYSMAIGEKIKYFAKFFRLCEAHHSKCSLENNSRCASATDHSNVAEGTAVLKYVLGP